MWPVDSQEDEMRARSRPRPLPHLLHQDQIKATSSPRRGGALYPKIATQNYYPTSFLFVPLMKFWFFTSSHKPVPVISPGGDRQGESSPLIELTFPAQEEVGCDLVGRKPPDPPGSASASSPGNTLAAPFLLNYIQLTPAFKNNCCFTLITPLAFPA